MAAPSQPENKKTIEAVLLSVEARQFWERVFICSIEYPESFAWASKKGTFEPSKIADLALMDWRERFEPKAGE